MAASLKTARIVGNLSVSLATWAHIFSPQTEEKKEKRGELLALISFKGLQAKNEEEAAAFGKEALTRLNEEYFGNLEKTPFEALITAVEKVANEVNGEQEVDLASAALVGNVLYLSTNSNSKAFLLRGEKFGLILDGPCSSSGYVQENDLFCLGTSDFLTLVSEETLQNSLSSGSPLSVVEMLAPLIHTLPEEVDKNSGGMGLVVAQVPSSPTIPKTDLSFSPEPDFVRRDININKPSRFEKLAPFKEKLIALWDKLPIPFLKQVEKSERHFRLRLGLALGLAIVVIAIAFFGRQQGQQVSNSAEIKALLLQAEGKKAEGQGLVDLNPLRAKELLLEAQDLFAQAESLTGGNSDLLDQFKKDLENALGQVLKGFEVEGQFFYDLSLIKSQATASQLNLFENGLVVLDRQQKAVYQLQTENNRTDTLAGGDFINQETIMATDESGDPWLFVGRKVYKANSKVSDFEDDWQEIKSAAYFNGFFYLVDSRGDEIWKVPITTTSLGASQAWLNDDLDLSNAQKILIDGSIWLLFDDNRIAKLTRGTTDVFKIEGLNEPLGRVVDFYTDENSSNLYLLDSNKAKIIVLEKDGQFIKEYHWSGLNEANLMVVEEDKNRLLVATNGKIYSLELK